MVKSTPACCTAITPTPVATCEKTVGPFGEIVNPWTTHPAIGAANPLIPVPVDPSTVIFSFKRIGSSRCGKLSILISAHKSGNFSLRLRRASPYNFFVE